MTILAPDSYKAGIYAIPAIAGGVYFTAVYSLYMRIELFYKKTTFATVASTIAAVSNIILNYIFIKLFIIKMFFLNRSQKYIAAKNSTLRSSGITL